LRVVHVLSMRASPLFDAPQMDALYHVEWARAFARGEEFQPGPYFRAPLYPWLLGLEFRAFGDGLLLPRLVQCLFGTATVFFAWRIARGLFGVLAGLVAAGVGAGYWVLIFYDGELLLESLCTPLYFAALWATLRAGERPARRPALLAGLLWGLGTIARPNVLPLLPLLAVWLFWRHRASRGLRVGAAFAVAWLAAIAPITAINVVRGGDFVLVASQGGVNLWIGNNPESDGTSAIVPGTREDWWGGYHDAIALAELEAGRDLRPSEVSAHYVSKAVAFAREEPEKWIALTLRKARFFWLDWEFGNNEEVRFLASTFSPIVAWTPIGFSALAAAALVGVAAAWRVRERALPLLLFTFVLSLTVIAFFVNARFRAPVLPAFVVLAGGAVAQILAWIDQRRFVALALAIVAAGASVAISRTLPSGCKERAESNGYLMLGAAELRARAFALARQAFGRALQLDPSNQIARRGLAEAAYFERDLVGARNELERVLAERGRDAFASELLGRVHVQRGDLDAAARAFRDAATASPRFFEAWYSLGVAELALHHPEAALDALAQAIACATRPDNFLLDAYQRAVVTADALGRPERASQLAREGLARFPSDPQLRQRTAGP
jgi:4-amino-4-deoxy-L-arabinose transferase-like glycosyltransferase